MAETNLKLGHYLILERLAHGGMAQIYKAKTADPNGIERLVVIKRILPHISSNPEYVEMLIDEAKIAVHFTHGNIAQVYDLGKAASDYFIVMEYVDGKTLGQILRELSGRNEHMPVDLAVYCMAEICRGLDYMHGKASPDGKPLGVVHRDISPQNIIVSYSGTVKIIDFGVAKSDDKISQTESGVLKGKFAYMSPEQADGKKLDGRSDIFSAGVLLWELLTGQRLFKRKNNPETVKAVRKAPVANPSRIRSDVPREVDKIVRKALQRKAVNRYQFASEMADDLDHFLMEYNPEFRPLHAAQFLLRYFGPEADEAGLPPELPELNVDLKPKPKKPEGKDSLANPDDEKTEVEKRYFFLSKRLVVAASVACLAVIFSFLVYGLVVVPFVLSGRLLIRVNPPSAKVYVNEKELNRGANKDGEYRLRYRAGKPAQILVVGEGYVAGHFTEILHRREFKKLSVNLAKEIPPYGDLFVNSWPLGAVIYLDDMELNRKTPATIPRLKNGKKHKIGVYLEGHVFSEQTVDIVGGETKNLEFRLSVNYANLEIISSPTGASVIIDDQVVGVTPHVLRLSPDENVRIELKLEGFEAVAQDVRLNAGEKKTVSLSLKKI